MTFWEVDILGVDILGVDILGRTRFNMSLLCLWALRGHPPSNGANWPRKPSQGRGTESGRFEIEFNMTVVTLLCMTGPMATALVLQTEQ